MLKSYGCFIFAVIDDLIATQSRFVVRTLRFPLYKTWNLPETEGTCSPCLAFGGGVYLWRILKSHVKCVAPISSVHVWMQGDVTVWTDTAGLTSVTEHNSWLASGRSPGRRFSTVGLWGFSLSCDDEDGWRVLFLFRRLIFRITFIVLQEHKFRTLASCCRVGQRSCGKVAKPGSKYRLTWSCSKRIAFLAWSKPGRHLDGIFPGESPERFSRLAINRLARDSIAIASERLRAARPVM